MCMSGSVKTYVIVQGSWNNIMTLEGCMYEMIFIAVVSNFSNFNLHNIKDTYLFVLLNVSSFREDKSRMIYLVQIN